MCQGGPHGSILKPSAFRLPPVCHSTRIFEEYGGLKIFLDPTAFGQDTGGDVWLGGLALTQLLYGRPSAVAGKRVLELGSGTGFVGLALARLRPEVVVLTDQVSLLPLLRKNLAANNFTDVDSEEPQVLVTTLDWECSLLDPVVMRQRPFDVVVASEVLYEPLAVRSFTATLLNVCDPHTVVYIGCCFYSEDHVRLTNMFLAKVARRFTWEDVTAECKNCRAFSRQGVVLYRLTPIVAEPRRVNNVVHQTCV